MESPPASHAAAKALDEGKPPEIELWTNRFVVHPLSRRLTTWLVPTRITPNQISCLGVVASSCAAAAYTALSWPISAFVGFGLHIGWHVLDGTDGDLARRTGRSSPNGEIVDGLCDYLSHIILYAALAAVLAGQIGGWAWALALVSGVARAIQANSFESRRRSYQHWVQGKAWLKQSLSAGATDDGRIAGPLKGLGRAYMAISRRVSAQDPELEAVLRSRLCGAAVAAASARALYSHHQAGALRSSFLLSSNARTVALFISMLATSPLYFFCYESVALSLVLVATLAQQRRRNRALLRALGQT